MRLLHLILFSFSQKHGGMACLCGINSAMPLEVLLIKLQAAHWASSSRFTCSMLHRWIMRNALKQEECDHGIITLHCRVYKLWVYYLSLFSAATLISFKAEVCLHSSRIVLIVLIQNYSAKRVKLDSWCLLCCWISLCPLSSAGT